MPTRDPRYRRALARARCDRHLGTARAIAGGVPPAPRGGHRHLRVEWPHASCEEGRGGWTLGACRLDQSQPPVLDGQLGAGRRDRDGDHAHAEAAVHVGDDPSQAVGRRCRTEAGSSHSRFVAIDISLYFLAGGSGTVLALPRGACAARAAKRKEPTSWARFLRVRLLPNRDVMAGPGASAPAAKRPRVSSAGRSRAVSSWRARAGSSSSSCAASARSISSARA